jgi:hypothetical protein
LSSFTDFAILKQEIALMNIILFSFTSGSIFHFSLFSTQESSWRCLELDVLEELSNFGGKIEIPAAMQYLLPKIDDLEVPRY